VCLVTCLMCSCPPIVNANYALCFTGLVCKELLVLQRWARGQKVSAQVDVQCVIAGHVPSSIWKTALTSSQASDFAHDTA
jgi:hypothetical protein